MDTLFSKAAVCVKTNSKNILITLFAAFSVIQCKDADQCVKQINTCACETATGFVNLEPLDLAKSSGIPKYANINGEGDSANDDYSYNPCTAFTSGTGYCKNVAGCQTHNSMDYSIGTQESYKFTIDPEYGSIISYEATGEDNIKRTLKLKLVCDPNQEGELKAKGETSTGSATFLMTLTTKYACSDIAKPPAGYVPDGPSGGDIGGLSPGSIMLILFFVGVTAYVVSGVVYNKVKKGSHGVELVPNIQFWTMLPGLAKDGVMYTKEKAMGLVSKPKQTSYDSI